MEKRLLMLKYFVKIIILCFVILLQISLGANAGINEVFLNSTVLVSYKTSSKKMKYGSGFLITKASDTFFITSKHLIPSTNDFKSFSIRISVVKNNEMPKVNIIEIPIFEDDNSYFSYVKMHPDKNVDVAAIDVTKFIKERDIKDKLLSERNFGTKNKLKAENITIGDEIFLLGYPQYFFDKRNNFPILRQGVIATFLQDGYVFNDISRKKYGLPSKLNGFLIDANVFSGSSGSQVILKPQLGLVKPDGSISFGAKKRTPYLLGIVSKSIPTDELGRLERMGLGIVYSIETIQEVIAEFYKE
ncbi:hypothetical protein N9A72_00415 [bacterium]|nr:hypothetical protein [bacterium]